MIGIGPGLSENEEFRTTWKKVNNFKIRYPQSGHGSDGCELYLYLSYNSAQDMVHDLDLFGFESSELSDASDEGEQTKRYFYQKRMNYEL